MQRDPLENIDAAILGMYAAVKIFRHNGIDPHKMVDAVMETTNLRPLDSPTIVDIWRQKCGRPHFGDCRGEKTQGI
jgi:hypothetical protein